MAKKFHVPPPKKPAAMGTTNLVIDESMRGSDTVKRVLNEWTRSGATDQIAKVWTRFGDYLERKLPAHDLDAMKSHLDFLTVLYVGRRTGTVDWQLPRSDGGRPGNDIGVVISHILTDLENHLGRQQATQIFRRLEKITDDELGKRNERAR